MLIELLHKQIQRRYHRLGFRSDFLDVGPFRLHYYERSNESSSKYLVLLHGLGTSSSTWIRTVPKLTKEWNILAMDLPGFGLSSTRNTTTPPRFQELYWSVAAFVEKKLPNPFTLLGHSLGGWLAAKFAAQHSEWVRHLILVDNAGVFYDGTIEQEAVFQVKSVRDVRRLVNTLWFRYPWYFKPFYAAVLKDLLRRRVPEFVRSIHTEDFVNNELGALNMDVDIIWGREDNLISMKSVEVMKHAIPHSHVHLIERCGHVPQLERPEEFIKILQGLLRAGVKSESTRLTVSNNRKTHGLA